MTLMGPRMLPATGFEMDVQAFIVAPSLARLCATAGDRAAIEALRRLGTHELRVISAPAERSAVT